MTARRPPGDQPVIYQARLETKAGGAGVRALRALIKRLGRIYGIRVLALRQAPRDGGDQ